MKKYLKSLVLLFLLCFILTGCGKIINSKEAIELMKEKYGIEVEIVSVEDRDDNSRVSKTANKKYRQYKIYTLKEKERNITFTLTSRFSSVGLDGSTFWYSADNTDDYYMQLTNSISGDIEELSQKYNIQFIRESFEDLIGEIVVPVDTEEEIDYDVVLSASTELMKLYNLKKEVKKSYLGNYIFISTNNDDTGNYILYTVNGETPKIYNSKQEFAKEWNIPDELEEKVLTYVKRTICK